MTALSITWKLRRNLVKALKVFPTLRIAKLFKNEEFAKA